jgi:hypothetical protein
MLYTIPFNYITFAAIWNGIFHVLAVDYYRYIIFILNPFESTAGKSVPCDYLKYMRKRRLSVAFENARKVIISFVAFLGPYFSPHRITRLTLDELSEDNVI